MAGVTFEREQRERSKADDAPLIAFCYDDRECGGPHGQFTFHGPVSRAAAKEAFDYFVAWMSRQKGTTE